MEINSMGIYEPHPSLEGAMRAWRYRRELAVPTHWLDALCEEMLAMVDTK